MTKDAVFPGHLFPSSFTILYCPHEEGCLHESPFTTTDALLAHLREAHEVEIENPAVVLPFLDRYLQARLAQPEIDHQQDLELRETLQQQRLQEILDLQAQERNTVHKRGRHCLFCSVHCTDLHQLFSHMFRVHDFNIGQLDNLVMVDEFLSALQAKLDRLTCIYCEGHFPNTPTLKKHLKNKRHYRIHAHDHAYDKYYIVNYLQAGKLYDEEEMVTMAGENDKDEQPSKDEVSDPEWGELTELMDERTTCLLCPHIDPDPEASVGHMKVTHGFDWERLRKESNLDTYGCIKLINYFRYRASENMCPYCGEGEECGFSTEVGLADHLKRDHPPVLTCLPDRRRWDTTRYLFPIYEDDPFLCHLDGEDNPNGEVGGETLGDSVVLACTSNS